MKKILLSILILSILISPSLATSTGELWIETQNTGAAAEFLNPAFFNNNNLNVTIVGGYDVGSGTYKGYAWTTVNGTDFQVVNDSAIPGRYQSAFTVFAGKMWIMGGYNASGYMNDTYSSTDGIIWNRVCESCGWLAKRGASAGVSGDKMYLLGGLDGVHTLAGTEYWFLSEANASAGTWTRVTSDVGAQFYGGTQMVEKGGYLWLVVWGYLYQITPATGAYAAPGPAHGMTYTQVARFKDRIVITGRVGTSSKVLTTTDGVTFTTANASANILITTPSAGYPLVNFSVPTWTVPWYRYEGLYLLDVRQWSTQGLRTYVTLEPPNASATPASASGTAPFAVAWTDTTSGYMTDWLWDFRDGYFSYERNGSHVFTSPGSYAIRFTPSSPFGSSIFISNVSVSIQQINVASNIHHVRLVFTRPTGRGIPGLNITANLTEVTYGSLGWIEPLLGVPSTVNVTETLKGATDSAGSIAFFMVQGARYDINVTNTTASIFADFTIYPIEDQYTFHIDTGAITEKNLYETVKWNLSSYDFSATEIAVNFTYNDTDLDTTALIFYVNNSLNGTPIFSQAVTLTDGNGSAGYVLTNTKGDPIVWGFIAENSAFGTIRDMMGLTMKGPAVKLVDLHLPPDAYLWISYLILFTVAGLFSGQTVKYGAVVIPLVGAALSWIGWLSISWVILGSLITLGVLIYINRSEVKTR